MPVSGISTGGRMCRGSGPVERTVEELAAHVGGRVVGDPAVVITGMASLDLASDHDIAYVDDDRLFDRASGSRASCIVAPEAAAVSAPCRIETGRPKLAFAKIGELLLAVQRDPPSIHPTAAIDPAAEIDPAASIGPHVTIGAEARVGARTRIEAGVVVGRRVAVGRECILHPNVVLYDGVQIGDCVVIHAGAVVGADGFGYVRDGETYRKFPQIGTVVIDDDVELGAGVTIDRGALGPTRVGRGSKLDNLVHVGHSVVIGERVLIAAQTGIGGSSVIEDDVVAGGQVGFGDHVRVQRGAMIGAKAGVLPGKTLRPGRWWGVPVRQLDEYKRLNALWHRLPKMHEELVELRRQLREVHARIAGFVGPESK